MTWEPTSTSGPHHAQTRAPTARSAGKCTSGSSPIGWPFLFRAPELPDGTFGRYDEWLQLASSGQIVDEYGASFTLTELLARIDGHAKEVAPPGQSDSWITRDEHGRRWAEHEFS